MEYIQKPMNMCECRKESCIPCKKEMDEEEEYNRAEEAFEQYQANLIEKFYEGRM